MRRFRRYIFNGVTVLSLLICLAMVVLWIRADDRSDLLAYNTGLTFHALIASPVGIEYRFHTVNPDVSRRSSESGWPDWHRGWLYDRGNDPAAKDGFNLGKTWPWRGFHVGLPYWTICLITGLAPAIWVIKRVRRKRTPPGLCPKCRYDLRATPDRCPECGTVPTKGAL